MQLADAMVTFFVLLVSALTHVVEATRAAGLRRSSYRQTLHNFQNVQYFGNFSIGGQAIAGLIDSGSWHLVVRSTRCGDCQHPSPPYNHSASATYRMGGMFSTLTYAAGRCHTVSGFDSVATGPLGVRNFMIQEIESHELAILDGAHYAAIVGLSRAAAPGGYLGSQSLPGAFGFSEFSFCLQRSSGSSGFLTWGPVSDTSMKLGDYTAAGLLGRQHWSVSLQNITFSEPGGEPAPVLCLGAGCSVTIDSGSSLIGAPPEALMQLSQKVAIKPDCSNLQELPTLRFLLGGHTFELPPDLYVLRVTGTQAEVDAVYDMLPLAPPGSKPNSCVAAFSPVSAPPTASGPLWILGMPFFRKYHTTFDYTRQEIRFAKAGPHCEPQPLGEAGRASSTNLLGSGPGIAGGVLEAAAAGLVRRGSEGSDGGGQSSA